jgi:phosphoenolpyruvate carboxykinase (GTP)
VLAWVFRRCEGTADAADTAIGRLPTRESLDLTGLDLSESQIDELLQVDEELWRVQLPQLHEHFAQFGERLPAQLREQLDALEQRLA